MIIYPTNAIISRISILAKKTYVLDTNVYLTEAESIMSFSNNDILVPLKVLDEID